MRLKERGKLIKYFMEIKEIHYKCNQNKEWGLHTFIRVHVGSVFKVDRLFYRIGARLSIFLCHDTLFDQFLVNITIENYSRWIDCKCLLNTHCCFTFFFLCKLRLLCIMFYSIFFCIIN